MCVVVTDMNKISILFILHIFYVCKLKYSKYLNISENFIKFMIKFPKNTPIDTFLNNGFQYTENSDENFYIILKFLIDNYDNYNTIKIEWKYDEIFSHIKSLKEILYDPFWDENEYILLSHFLFSIIKTEFLFCIFMAIKKIATHTKNVCLWKICIFYNFIFIKFWNYLRDLELKKPKN